MRAARSLFLALAVPAALTACKPQQQGATPAPAATAPPAITAPGPAAPAAELKDEVESTPAYVIGISYPDLARRYPGLGEQVAAYAAAAKQELMAAVAALGGAKPSAPYELSLEFDAVVDTPQVATVAANGTRYTGGAHGEPLVERFTWLPQQHKALTTQTLLPAPGAWDAISSYVREQLYTQASVRADNDNVPPEQREAVLKNVERMIDDGTTPKPENFGRFEPVMDANGRIAAIRFVFPPYQVASYADGTRTVDVPAALLKPYLTPEYAGLFAL
ncbi:MAG: hypothetical protein QM601_07640 [Pseudoxanthomonas sp.]